MRKGPSCRVILRHCVLLEICDAKSRQSMVNWIRESLISDTVVCAQPNIWSNRTIVATCDSVRSILRHWPGQVPPFEHLLPSYHIILAKLGLLKHTGFTILTCAKSLVKMRTISLPNRKVLCTRPT